MPPGGPRSFGNLASVEARFIVLGGLPFDGMPFLPFPLRASLKPIATACFLLFTLGPFLLPECNVPRLNSPITLCTLSEDLFAIG